MIHPQAFGMIMTHIKHFGMMLGEMVQCSPSKSKKEINIQVNMDKVEEFTAKLLKKLWDSTETCHPTGPS